ncbi:MAG: hypothetical protein ACE5JX_17880 [Acidobacteriota bacterium]
MDDFTVRSGIRLPLSSLVRGFFGCSLFLILTCRVGAGAEPGQKSSPSKSTPDTLATTPETWMIGIGDSLTHGTMDATNNLINTLNAYFERVGISLATQIRVHFEQPLFSLGEERLEPFKVPTNLAVDGADAFSVEGIQYFKRAGAPDSFVTVAYLSDKLRPDQLEDKYDKVMYPINLTAGRPVSQIGAANWLVNRAGATGVAEAVVIMWAGNNDSSVAALGAGGSNPEFQPIPLAEIAPEIKPALRLLLELGEESGAVSFEPYTQAALERNLTEASDFTEQYDHLLTRLEEETAASGVQVERFLLTLPYYSAVGYLFDSDDLEFYLKKLDPTYSVPPTFKRVADPGQPITDPFRGDRIALLTFGFMYALLDSGHSVDYVNQVLELDGQQRDGLVLSEAEQQFIISRIDGFNASIQALVALHGPTFHLVAVGQFLNAGLGGGIEIVVGDKVLSRKWVRGSGFSLDGVHPSYTGQALVANFVLNAINQALALSAPGYDLEVVLNSDPYVDVDGDGWAPGPDYSASGLTQLLFLFRDPDDSDATMGPVLPDDVWDLISDILLQEFLGISSLREEARRKGLLSTP